MINKSNETVDSLIKDCCAIFDEKGYFVEYVETDLEDPSSCIVINFKNHDLTNAIDYLNTEGTSDDLQIKDASWLSYLDQRGKTQWIIDFTTEGIKTMTRLTCKVHTGDCRMKAECLLRKLRTFIKRHLKSVHDIRSELIYAHWHKRYGSLCLGELMRRFGY